MSKILANQIANFGDDSPIEIKEGLNVPAGKPLQAAGSAGSAGQVLSTTGTTIQWVTPFNGDYNSLSNRPTIPAAQVNSDWNATSGVSVILNKPVVPPQPSVTTNAAGTAALSYNSTNGQFTYTPPDLSGFADGTNEANWDTAYGWGDHSAAGYLTAEADTLETVTGRGYTTTNNIVFNDGVQARFGTLNGGGEGDLRIYHALDGSASVIQEAGGTDLVIMTAGSDILFRRNNEETYAEFHDNGSVDLYYDNDKKFETTTEGVTITGSAGNNNLQVDGDALVIGALTAGGLTYPTTNGNAGQILTSDGAGNVVWGAASGGGSGIALSDLSVTTNAAGSAALTYNNISGVFTYTPPDLSGYLSAETDPVFQASAASGITSTNITNWNLAYGWGNHAGAGYLTSYTETDPVFSASEAANITSTDTTNWDTAYGWGDHASAGYLTSQASVALNDVTDVTITSPTSGQVLSYNGSAWVNTAAATGNTQVTISDTLPAGTPNAGDLWWESDTGRLKIYYQDTDTSQWVDTNPPLADATSIGGSGTVAMLASVIPDTNAAYDLGNAEYKIRDLYLSQASDARLKTDVVNYTGGLAFVESLRVVDFTWKDDVAEKAGKRETGLIAQEVKEALDASNYNSWRLHTDGDTQGLDREQLIPALISAIQELSARVKELENK